MNFKLVEIEKIIFSNPIKDRNLNEFSESQALVELMSSILSVGLLQPICVIEKGDEYELLFGKRRLIACQRINLSDGEKFKTIPCIVLANNNDFPREISILHENRYRENIRKDIYIESSLTLLPRFISDEAEFSFKQGMLHMSDYILFKEGVYLKVNPNISNFIQSIDKFLLLTNIELVEFQKYQKISEMNHEINDRFYSNTIYFSDAVLLDEIQKKDNDLFLKILLKISAQETRSVNHQAIAKNIKTLKFDEVKNTLEFVRAKFKNVRKIASSLEKIDEEDSVRIKELALEIEMIFKKIKGKK